MGECQNCGRHVSTQYERVFSVHGADGVACCPWCPDTVRVDGEVREARSNRRTMRDAAQQGRGTGTDADGPADAPADARGQQ